MLEFKLAAITWCWDSGLLFSVDVSNQKDQRTWERKVAIFTILSEWATHHHNGGHY